MSSLRPRILAILIVCAVLLPTQRAVAERPLLDDIAWLPADVDLALVVKDMSRIRGMPLGRGATDLVASGIQIGGAGQSRTLEAWRSLAERLGFTEDQAFDALLGMRFGCAARERADGTSDWVMYSKTTPRIARLVRRKLDVAPREIKHDRVLMTLEGGAFRLGSLIEEDNAWLMLAPTDRDGLFQQITDAGGHPEWARLGDGAAFEQLRALGGGDLALYTTLGKPFGGAQQGWFALGAEAWDDTIRFRMTSDPGQPLPQVEPWSTTLFDELRDGALLSHIERLPAKEEAMGLRQLPAKEEAMGLRQRGRDRDGSLWAAMRQVVEIPHRVLGEDLNLILGRRLAVAAYPNPAGGLDIAIGLEASDVTALAEPGDAAMKSLVASMQRFYNAHQAKFEFVGRLPRAKRQITLEPDAPGGLLPPFGRALDITWSFRDTPGAAPAGWWVAGTDEPSFAKASGALTTAPDPGDGGEVRPWLMLFEAHPASVVESLRRGGVPVAPNAAGIDLVDTIRMRTWIEYDPDLDLVRGDGEVRIIDPERPRKGPRLHRR
ncbi:MAG: hypothetical protein H6814_04570 [Phycisphaeraceae bacterium]|nr:hypothetical protein [Phycisphaeraceae bacterium]